jgi:hypothetical protein
MPSSRIPPSLIATSGTHMFHLGKKTKLGASGVVVGAIVAGPLGALVGGVLGTAFGAAAASTAQEPAASHPKNKTGVTAAAPADKPSTKSKPKRRQSKAARPRKSARKKHPRD